LAAGIAHDFNNHLAAILGNISYLRSPRGISAEELASCHDDIEIATRKSAELVSQLLAFAQPRLEGGSCRLGELADQIQSLLKRTLSANVRLDVDVPRDMCVVGDPGQLSQVLTNLCINGADAMPEGGLVRVQASSVQLGGEHETAGHLEPGDYVRLEVTDEGVGMDDSTRHRALEPFFTTKPRGKGTGLGLATVARIVDLHGGLLQLDSEPGQGTTVRIWLPQARPKPVERRINERVTLLDLEDRRILLVDDEEIVLRSTARLLERSGARVMTANDGATAVEMFRARERPIKLVVLDLDMPGMDGAETLLRIREIEPSQPVLVVTGHVDPVRINKVLSLPGVSLLRKPYDYRTLAEAVDRAVAG
jgi:CheY-like chemotaxis protein